MADDILFSNLNISTALMFLPGKNSICSLQTVRSQIGILYHTQKTILDIVTSDFGR